jgi:glycosyltransferase involved in cell wall biosynthesis
LHEIIKSKHLNNILIHKAVDQQEYFSMLSEFDAGLISLHRKFKTSNFPGKMLGYMYFSMPVLATINAGNDLQQILEQNEAGLVSINGDDDLLKQNAIKLIRSIDERLRIGLNGRNLLETTFSVSRASKQILSHFENTVNN